MNIYAQQYWSKRYDLQDGNDDGLKLLAQDSSFLLESFGLCNGNNDYCFGLTKLNYDGEQLWKYVVDDSVGINHVQSFDVLDDTIFINTYYYVPSDSAYTILALDQNGQYVSRRDYHNVGISGDFQARELIRYGDRTYTSFAYRDTNSLKGTLGLRAYDRDWNVLWGTTAPDGNYSISWSEIEPTLDSGIILIYTYGNQGTHAAIERYDNYGNRLWITNFSEVYNIGGQFVTILPYPDGSFFGVWYIDSFTGNPHKNSYPDILFKLNASGEFEWQRIQEDKWENFSRMFVNQDGNIIGCGLAYNKPSNAPGTIEWQAGYIRCMNTDGEELWDRRIIDSTGGGRGCVFNYGTELENGDLLFSGIIRSGLDVVTSQRESWIVKTDANGCLTPGCQDTFQILVPSKEAPGYREPDIFSLLPNPFTDRLVLGTLLGYRVPPGDYHAAVYDLQGRVVVAPRPINPDLLTVFEMEQQPAGLYVVQVFRDGQVVQALKAVKS